MEENNGIAHLSQRGSYVSIGVVAVIPPWNFPLAIPTGMATAAIAAGNTVVMKPSSDSPANAYVLHDVLDAAGLPAGVFNMSRVLGAMSATRWSDTRTSG